MQNYMLFFSLYHILMKKKKTVVYKKDLPKIATICEIIKVKSPKTYRAHLQYLIKEGYIIEEEEKYVLPNKEDIFFMIPLETLYFLTDTLTEQVIKIYIYLGQKDKFKKGYEFTVVELASHIGIKLNGNQRGYDIINNALLCLKKLELIDFVEYYENEKPKKKLTKFSLHRPTI